MKYVCWQSARSGRGFHCLTAGTSLFNWWQSCSCWCEY